MKRETLARIVSSLMGTLAAFLTMLIASRLLGL